MCSIYMVEIIRYDWSVLAVSRHVNELRPLLDASQTFLIDIDRHSNLGARVVVIIIVMRVALPIKSSR